MRNSTNQDYAYDPAMQFMTPKYKSPQTALRADVNYAREVLQPWRFNLHHFRPLGPPWFRLALDGTNWHIHAAGNPIMYNDPTGNWAHIIFGAAIGGLISGAMDFGMQMIANGGDISQVSLRSIGASFVSGAVSGELASATGGLSLAGQVKYDNV